MVAERRVVDRQPIRDAKEAPLICIGNGFRKSQTPTVLNGRGACRRSFTVAIPPANGATAGMSKICRSVSPELEPD